MHRFSDKPGAVVPHRPSLTERHRAPTGGPTRTQVRVGGGGNAVRPSNLPCTDVLPACWPPHLQEVMSMATVSVKLDLLVAKFDFYKVTHQSRGDWPLCFAINREGMFLFVKPMQFALLWPWVKL